MFRVVRCARLRPDNASKSTDHQRHGEGRKALHGVQKVPLDVNVNGMPGAHSHLVAEIARAFPLGPEPRPETVLYTLI